MKMLDQNGVPVRIGQKATGTDEFGGTFSGKVIGTAKNPKPIVILKIGNLYLRRFRPEQVILEPLPETS
jgi:hypothetical protein